MAGEDQYIHPVIQAIMGAVQARQAQQNLAATIAQRQQENQQAAQRIKQEEERIANEHEYQKGMLEHQHDLYQSTLDAAKLNALKFIRESGGNPTDIANSGGPGIQTPDNLPGVVGGLQTVPDTRSLNLPSFGLNIPLSGIPTLAQQQQQMGDIEAQQAGKKAGAVAAAEQPFNFALEELKYGHAKAMQGAAQDFTTRLETDVKQPFEANMKKLDRQSQMALEGVRAGMEKYRVDKEYGVSPDQLTTGVYGLLTGQTKPNMANPVDRQMALAAMQIGRIIPEKDVEALRGTQAMGPLFDKLNEWKDKYLPDEQELGSNKAKAIATAGKALLGMNLSSDAKNELNQITSQAFSVARNIDSVTQGRIPMQEVYQVLNGFANYTTKQQADRNIKFMKDILNNKVGSVIEGGMPTTQQNMLYTSTGVTPPWITQQLESTKGQQMKANGFEPNIEDSIKKGVLVYDKP